MKIKTHERRVIFNVEEIIKQNPKKFDQFVHLDYQKFVEMITEHLR